VPSRAALLAEFGDVPRWRCAPPPRDTQRDVIDGSVTVARELSAVRLGEGRIAIELARPSRVGPDAQRNSAE
jgi:hypothetical protein